MIQSPHEECQIPMNAIPAAPSSALEAESGLPAASASEKFVPVVASVSVVASAPASMASAPVASGPMLWSPTLTRA